MRPCDWTVEKRYTATHHEVAAAGLIREWRCPECGYDRYLPLFVPPKGGVGATTGRCTHCEFVGPLGAFIALRPRRRGLARLFKGE